MLLLAGHHHSVGGGGAPVARQVPGATEQIAAVCAGHDYSQPGKPDIDWDDPAAMDALVSALVDDANAGRGWVHPGSPWITSPWTKTTRLPPAPRATPTSAPPGSRPSAPCTRDSPLRERCTTSKTGRKIVLHDRDDLLREARQRWRTTTPRRVVAVVVAAN